MRNFIQGVSAVVFVLLLLFPQAWAGGKTSGKKFFKDCSTCPEMVVIPAGEFLMGTLREGDDWRMAEVPQHKVKIDYRYAVSRYEVTFAQWDACVKAKGCSGYSPSDEGWGRGKRPVMNVSYKDAKNYVGWLTTVTGKNYRLLSEAEWEYAARAGTTTRFHTGDCLNSSQEHVSSYGRVKDERCRREDGNISEQTSEVGRYKPNAFGLHDMHGNVAEWVADCFHGNYDGAPTDGSVWRTGCNRNEPSQVVRGGSVAVSDSRSRSASRGYLGSEKRGNAVGFRVAVSL